VLIRIMELISVLGILLISIYPNFSGHKA